MIIWVDCPPLTKTESCGTGSVPHLFMNSVLDLPRGRQNVFDCLFGASVRNPSRRGGRFTLIRSANTPIRSTSSGSAPGIAFTWT